MPSWPGAVAGGPSSCSLTHLYAEPKKLVAAGLARKETARAGPRRTRTDYRITPEGRRELRRWLGTPAALPALNNEATLRLGFADHGSPDQLVATLEQLTTDTENLYREGLAQVEGYLRDGGPFPERLHLIALVADFNARFLELYMDWLDDARNEVLDWPGTRDLGMTASARHRLDRILQRGQRRQTRTEASEFPP
jgi:DNA-binding PadR family transcriptional regulator